MAYALHGPLLAAVQEAQQRLFSRPSITNREARPSSREARSAAAGRNTLTAANGITVEGVSTARHASPSRHGADRSQKSWPTLSYMTTQILQSPLTALSHVARGLTSHTASHGVTEETMRGLGTLDMDDAHHLPPLPIQPATAAHVPQQPFTLGDFLSRADRAEVQYASLLADLSDLAYDLRNVNEEQLQHRHNLKLVTTSSYCMLGPNTRQQEQTQQANSRQKQSGDKHTQQQDSQQQPQESWLPGQHSVTADVAVAVANQVLSSAAVTDAEAQLISHRLSASGMSGGSSPVLTPSVSLITLPNMGEADSATQETYPLLTFQPVSSSPAAGTSAVNAGSSPDGMTAHSIVVTLPLGNSSPQSTSTQPVVIQVPVIHIQNDVDAQQPSSPQACALTSGQEPPAAWFCADDKVTHIRYFAIQGSTSFNHWQINLKFEPVIFESASLGVRVHQGVYSAALKLYDDLLPLVRQHVASSPFASVAFTGHSLGGSLASLLMLLFVARGVLPADCVSPVHTFGAPAVFCGGAPANAPEGQCEQCGLACEHAGHATPPRQEDTGPDGGCGRASRKHGLLAQLGLGEEHIINVIMHRDIVPRAFVCDYKMVADLLKTWMPSLKDHSLLQGPAHAHKSLYNFLGRISLLQPEAGCSFVQPSDAKHPHLPPVAGLYRMVAPAPRDLIRPPDASPAPVAQANTRAGKGHKAPSPVQPAPATLREAVLHFMNNPHPLTTLTEYTAYGPNGSISRYHNPMHYTIGLLSLIGGAPHQLAARTEGSLIHALAALAAAPMSPACSLDASGWGEGCDAASFDLISPDARRLLVTHSKAKQLPSVSQGTTRRGFISLAFGLSAHLFMPEGDSNVKPACTEPVLMGRERLGSKEGKEFSLSTVSMCRS